MTILAGECLIFAVRSAVPRLNRPASGAPRIVQRAFQAPDQLWPPQETVPVFLSHRNLDGALHHRHASDPRRGPSVRERTVRGCPPALFRRTGDRRWPANMRFLRCGRNDGGDERRLLSDRQSFIEE